MDDEKYIIQKLIDGNQRFINGTTTNNQSKNIEKRLELINYQKPYAIILCCSDSRVPAEFIFDVDLGDLFVIRIAGNIVAPSIVGSIEYAITKFQVKIIIVMGHTNCGAVIATVEKCLNNSLSNNSNSIKDIVDRIYPSIVEIVKSDELKMDSKILMSVRTNIHASVNQLKHASRILENKCLNNDLLIFGALYNLENGLVDFFF